MEMSLFLFYFHGAVRVVRARNGERALDVMQEQSGKAYDRSMLRGVMRELTTGPENLIGGGTRAPTEQILFDQTEDFAAQQYRTYEDRKLFGERWTGPDVLEYAVWTEVAVWRCVEPVVRRVTVSVIAMPERYYRLSAEAHEADPAIVMSTGASVGVLLRDCAEQIAHGAIGCRLTTP